MDLGIVTPSGLGGLNDVEGDLMLDERGDVVVVTGPDAIAQHIRIRFSVFRGEVFTDLRIGFPWFEEVLVKGPDFGRIRALVAQTIETTPGIAEVNSVSLDRDRAARRLTVHFRATTTTGAVVDSADYAPFILGAGR